MKIIDAGVLPSSFMDFSMPSDFARDALFYVTEFGHFYCDENYRVQRDWLELYLMIYVCSGELTVETEKTAFNAEPDQIVILDCRDPHCYYCRDRAEFLWFHFNGNCSQQYTSYLFEHFGNHFMGETIPTLKSNFQGILSRAQSFANSEHGISSNIHQIFSRLAVPAKQGAKNEVFAPAIDDISKRYEDVITLDHLAALCNMSTSHFIRSFKKQFGCTPHEYLLGYRIRQSKLLLFNTALSIEQIAENCGFNSASHFARAFRKSSGMSPTEFRTIQF